MTSANRRDFLRTRAAAGGAGIASTLFPPAIREALAMAPRRCKGNIEDVEHVVILMQENRSLDDYFGALSGVRGFGDRFPIPVPDSPGIQNATVAPFRPNTLQSFEYMRVEGTPHAWPDSQGAWGPAQGADHTARVLEAPTANPEVWARTVLFVNFDENDGFFDPMPPPAAPSYLVWDADESRRVLAGGSTVDTLGEYHELVPRDVPAERAAPLHEPYGFGPRVPMYVVSPFGAGHELGAEWDTTAEGGRYDWWVLGPNGFHRHFAGDLAASEPRALDPELRIEHDRRRGGIVLLLHNRGGASCTIRLTANADDPDWEPQSFRVGSKNDREHFLSLRRSASWYDFTLRVVGLEAYSRRFAGRVETGRHSLSDPEMGGRARGEQS